MLIISASSVLPLFLLGWSAFQAAYFHKHRAKSDFNINNDADLTEEEWNILSVYMRNSYIISAVLYVPFIFLFITLIKVIASIVIFAVAFTGAPIYFRIKHGKEYQSRYKREAEELKKQKKKEELGRWK